MPKIHPVFRPEKKGDELEVVYLYEDGHVVARFERRMSDIAATTDYIKVAESVGVRARFAGRVIFRDPLLLVMASMLPEAAVSMSNASPEAGSDNTRQRGIAVGSFSVSSPLVAGGYKSGRFGFAVFPDLISAPVQLQPEVRETWAEVTAAYRWAEAPIVRRYDAQGKVHQAA